MNTFRYINLTSDEVLALEIGYESGEEHHYRQRCHALLLSHAGQKIGEISRALNKRPETIRKWMTAFENLGISGLFIASGRGRKATKTVKQK